jgi:hypothetical protein
MSSGFARVDLLATALIAAEDLNWQKRRTGIPALL